MKPEEGLEALRLLLASIEMQGSAYQTMRTMITEDSSWSAEHQDELDSIENAIPDNFLENNSAY